MRISFLGTPDFAVPSLKMLVEDGHEICVFTQPDRPKGRGYELAASAVKQAAQEYGLPVYQPQKISSPEGIALLREADPEMMVTAAWGQLLSKEALAIPRYGCVNVHGSLLPKYRGAAPVQCAIINGEAQTGVTTMLTDVGLDTGDILLSRSTPIGEDETAGELLTRLAGIGAEVLRETIEALRKGTIIRTPQDPAQATRCAQLKKEDGHIDFLKSALSVHNIVRGVNPWPGAYAINGGETIKIWRTRKCDLEKGSALPGDCVIADPKQGLFVACGDGCVEVLEMQFPGSKRMDAKSALRGHSLSGVRFS
ncbi:MAG: methionyl-tRNA formyltransferase [Bacillota bacterium]